MDFAQFLAAYDDLIARTRENKLTVADFEGTTISLTNPGTVGTMGSNPRLMPGQGAIIATGAIDYPPEYRGVPEDMRTSLGLSKVMTVTCTYDHRVIQGAESGLFLGRLQALLEGEDGFYESIFASFGIPMPPVRWEPDQAAAPLINADPMKQAAVARLIQAWRERGHLVADLDPLGSTRPPHPDLEPSAHGLTIWDLDRRFHAGSFGVTDAARAERPPAGDLRGQNGRPVHAHRQSRGAALAGAAHGADREPVAARSGDAAAHFERCGRGGRIRNVSGPSLQRTQALFARRRRIDDRDDRGIAGPRGAPACVQKCVIGMSHRGRLSTLVNIVGKSMVQLFSEFEGEIDPESIEGQGDVKYHLGATGVRRTVRPVKRSTSRSRSIPVIWKR